MTFELPATDIIWLREGVRRIREGLPLDQRAMLVELRRELPRGFLPTHVTPGLIRPSGPTVLGLMALGDADDLLNKVESAVQWIRDKVITDPNTRQITGEALSTEMGLDLQQAKRLLELIGSMGGFSAGAVGVTGQGHDSILLDNDDVVASYLAFESLDAYFEAVAQHGRHTVNGSHAPEHTPPDRGDVFVLMNMNPEDPTLDDVLNGIKGVCASYGLEARRIDDEEHSDRITDRIIARIKASDLIIADLSGARPNVYYEVGFAHALGKRPILYRKRGTSLHFDLAVHNVPEYNNVTELRSLLHRRLEAILGRSTHFEDPC